MGLFSKKIVFSEHIEEFISSLGEIPWFSMCGESFATEVFFHAEQEPNFEVAIKHLNYKANARGIVTLEHLLGQANGRYSWFLYRNYKKEHQHTCSKLADIFDHRFAITKQNRAGIFSKQEEMYYTKFPQNERPPWSWMSWIICGTIQEMYFLEYIEEYPVFYTKVFDVYANGHIITGWRGQFPSQDKCLDTPIMPDDGVLLIY